MPRVLLCAATTGYQTRMFAEAAARLGVTLVYATDRCDHIEDPWADQAIPIRFHEEVASVEAILQATKDTPIDGVLVVGDRPTVVAAAAAHALGLPWHPVPAARAARDKRVARELWRDAGLPVPRSESVMLDADPRAIAAHLEYPVVIKPTVLSGSRGVMRADGPADFITRFGQLKHILLSPDVRELRDPEANTIQIEDYIDGDEYAVEGLMNDGRFHPLAIFDKPDPLTGPFFEETIYVTPSRAGDATRDAVHAAIDRAAHALGLQHGPVHAECRVRHGVVYVLEVAARPIGGLCAQALRFVRGAETIGLEELLLRHALGEDIAGWTREGEASGVMMIPIPKGGIYRRADGVEEALQVPGVTGVTVTAKPDQRLIPLPEGSAYLGFIFARAAAPDLAERALRAAHDRLRFVIEAAVPMIH